MNFLTSSQSRSTSSIVRFFELDVGMVLGDIFNEFGADILLDGTFDGIDVSLSLNGPFDEFDVGVLLDGNFDIEVGLPVNDGIRFRASCLNLSFSIKGFWASRESAEATVVELGMVKECPGKAFSGTCFFC